MAVSGLEQRYAPMILTQPVWSPWGMGVLTPWSHDEDEGGRPLDETYKLKPTRKERKRSRSWGGLATFMQNTRYMQMFGQRPVKNDTTPFAGTDYQKHYSASEAHTEASTCNFSRASVSDVTFRTDDNDFAANFGVACQKESTSESLKAPTNTDLGNATTLTIRNLPCKLTREEFVQGIDSSGFAGLYDFVYLPHKFDVRSNLGFGFINFANVDVAQRFRAMWHGSRRFTLNGTSNLKHQARLRPLNVAAAALQGRAANLQHAKGNRFDRVVNASFRPLVLASSADISDSASR